MLHILQQKQEAGIAGKGTNGAVSAGEGAVTGGMSKIESIFSGIFNYRSVVDENAALERGSCKTGAAAS